MMQNELFHPFLPLNEYIPDGEPHVFGDRIYLYGSHDKAGGKTYCEGDYEFYSAPLDDLTNWTSRGISYRAVQDPDYGEKRRYLFAPDCVQGNDGRYYLYYGISGKNGNGGYHGRKFRERIALTGNNHGSLACVRGQWYAFYHRPTHGTNFSRQACVEPVTIREDGSIPQVPVTSCGFCGRALKPEGVYSAAVACILRNRHMGIAGSPLTERYAPKIVEKNEEIYITNITHGTKTGFRYFDFSGEETELVITVRGSARGTLYVGTDRDTVVPVAIEPSEEWIKVTARIAPEKGRKTLLLVYRGKGRLEIRELEFIRRK